MLDQPDLTLDFDDLEVLADALPRFAEACDADATSERNPRLLRQSALARAYRARELRRLLVVAGHNAQDLDAATLTIRFNQGVPDAR